MRGKPSDGETNPDADLREELQSMEAKVRKMRETRNSLREQGKAIAKKRDAVLKKFNTKSCAALPTEEEKKACFKALDDAHVADHEE